MSIDLELPRELSSLPRWTFARELLVEAQRSGKKRDLTCATRPLKQALSNEDWLADKSSVVMTFASHSADDP
jgi:hypothetical protein